MQINKSEAARILELVSELADIASMKDIDVAVQILGDVARHLNVQPTTLAKYNELAAL